MTHATASKGEQSRSARRHLAAVPTLAGSASVFALMALSTPLVVTPASAAFQCVNEQTGDEDSSQAPGGIVSGNMACGSFAKATGADTRSTAVGGFSNAFGSSSTSLGFDTLASGANSTALGENSYAGGQFVNGIGQFTNAGNTAVGQGSKAGTTGNDQVNNTVVGQGATANVANGAAFGQGATVLNSGSVALGQGSTTNRDNSVSVGGGTIATRQITNVAAGTQGTDAVNLTQLNSAVAGIAAAPFVASNNLGRAAPTATGSDSVAGGYGATATNAFTTAIGNGATASGFNSVAVGNGSVANQDNTFSVGALGNTRRIVNVTAGTLAQNSTDAVNGGQLFTTNQAVATNTANLNTLGQTTAAALGDGATYNPATGISGLNYGLNGTATTFTNVVAGQQALASGAAGPVQYATPGTPSNALRLVGAGGAVTLGNVAAGTLAANSTDAVNGGQLFATNQQVATNTGNITALQNGTAGPFRADNTGNNAAPQASGANAVAGGFGAVSSGGSATAVGTGAQATQFGATAYGAGAVASGDPTTAIGYNAQATGNEASAFGGFATASATNATALGRSATASGTNAVAVGAFSSATQANSVAIGQGVATSRANQVAIGSGNQTYTMAGLPSAQSSAAQSGTTRFVTSDASGNLAASNFGPNDIASLDGRVTNLEAAVGDLRRDVRSAFSGTAIALALSGAVLPPGRNYALSGGFGTYHGQTAFGASGVARISDNLYATGGVGFATTGNSNVGGRAGLTYAW